MCCGFEARLAKIGVSADPPVTREGILSPPKGKKKRRHWTCPTSDEGAVEDPVYIPTISNSQREGPLDLY